MMSRDRGFHGYLVLLLLVGCWIGHGVTCPLPCRCVQGLYVYCDALEITDDNLNSDILDFIPSTVTYIDLSNNKLKNLTEGTFARFENLIYIDLSENQLDSIATDTFKDLGSLQRIYLQGNALARLRSMTFRNLTSLKELNLETNAIRNVDEQAFFHVPSLQILKLSHNQLTNLSRPTFSGMVSLELLDLSHNSLTDLEDGPFSPLVNLETLDLGHNQLRQVTSGVFYGLQSVKDLNLEHNVISQLHRDTFDPFRRKLERLSLAWNEITSINSDVFLAMGQLSHVDFSFNKISWLGSNIFQGLSPKFVSFKGNKLIEITRSMFSATRRIVDLDLSENEITKVYIGAFDSFKLSLYHVHLHSNKLEIIELGIFTGMVYLQSLDLSNNSIIHIENGAFRDLERLRILNLAGNELGHVIPGIMEGTGSLSQLDLHCNPVKTFQWTKFGDSHRPLKISLNLTVEDVTEQSVSVRWPYQDGSQLYWSVFVTCLESESCPFRPQATFLPPYQKQHVITELSPSSKYYICVNPDFVSENIDIQQCSVVATPRMVVTVTTAVELPVTGRSESASTGSKFNVPLFVLMIALLLHVIKARL